MFVAQLKGKLTRSEEDMEDLLTSNVFGVWRYLPPELGLLQFLETAQCITDGKKYKGPKDVVDLKIQFWPWLKVKDAKGAEPDVLIEMISSQRQKYLVLIEAKYLSGKASLPNKDPQPNDQLAREMHNLLYLAQQENANDYVLVYVTAHTLMPKEDIQVAIDELASKIGDSAAERFYWTTWRKLPSVLSKVKYLGDKPAFIMLNDLETVIRHMGLIFFEGIQSKGWTLGRTPWIFQRPGYVNDFNWHPINIGAYSFHKHK